MRHLAAENAYTRLLLAGNDDQKKRISLIRKEIESHMWALTIKSAMEQEEVQPIRSSNLPSCSAPGGKDYIVRIIPGPVTDIGWMRGRREASLLLPSAQVDRLFGPCLDEKEEARHGPSTLLISRKDQGGSGEDADGPPVCQVTRASGPFIWSPDGHELFFLSSSRAQLWSILPSSPQPTPRLVLTDPEWLEMEFGLLPGGLHTLQAKNNDGTVADAYFLLPSKGSWGWEKLMINEETHDHSSRGVRRGRRLMIQPLNDLGYLIVRHWSADEPFGSIFLVRASSRSNEGGLTVRRLVQASPGCRIVIASVVDANHLLVVEQEIDELEMEAMEMAQTVLRDEVITSSSCRGELIEGPSGCSFRIRLLKIDLNAVAVIEEGSTMLSLPIPFVKISEVGLRRGEGSTPAAKLNISSLGTPPQAIHVQLTCQGGSCQVDLDSHYSHKRLWFRSHDRCLIPISLISALPSTSASPPILVRAYGAFGLEDDLSFSPSRLPLVERGWIMAMVHVRGGGQLGPAWHEAGRGKRRSHGAEDLRAGMNALSDHYGAKASLFLEAESAGAWCALPALFCPSSFSFVKGALLTVPSLDPVSDLLEQGYAWHELLDLTPHSDVALDEIYSSQSYKYLRSSIDPLAQESLHNIVNWPRDRSLLVRCGLRDSKVGFWEGAGFVAQVRTATVSLASGQKVCFKIKDGGHNCFSEAQDDAEACSFLIESAT